MTGHGGQRRLYIKLGRHLPRAHHVKCNSTLIVDAQHVAAMKRQAIWHQLKPGRHLSGQCLIDKGHRFGLVDGRGLQFGLPHKPAFRLARAKLALSKNDQAKRDALAFTFFEGIA